MEFLEIIWSAIFIINVFAVFVYINEVLKPVILPKYETNLRFETLDNTMLEIDTLLAIFYDTFVKTAVYTSKETNLVNEDFIDELCLNVTERFFITVLTNESLKANLTTYFGDNFEDVIMTRAMKFWRDAIIIEESRVKHAN